MHLLLMALVFFGVTLDEITILDITEGIWVAPGYLAVEEATIDPVDYNAEPMGVDVRMDGAIRLACLGFFVETDEGEKWRIVMVFKDKVIVVQEDTETREIPLTISGQGAFFSKGGRYVLVHEGIYGSTANELINIDEGASEPFDYGLSDGVTFTWVGDDGTVLTHLTQDRHTGEYGLLSFYDHSELVNTVEGGFAGVSMSRDGSLIICGGYPANDPLADYAAIAFDREGSRLWIFELNPDMHLHPSGVAIAPNGEYVIINGNAGLECYSGAEGELHWRSNGWYSVISPSGEYCLLEWRNYNDADRMANHVPIEEIEWGLISCRQSDLILDSECSPVLNIRGTPQATSDNGNSLLYYRNCNIRPASNHRYCVMDPDGNIFMITPWYSTNTGSHSAGQQNNNSEPTLGAWTAALSRTGMKFLYDDGYSIHVIRIEEAAE
ncbi:MAG: hypothetical protein K8S24_07620 [Candidatus Aegiribacteria sp.]|nr:hypothetical protein [Candidatus Aegiribacteria sp.]